jgi:hypothetical protein
MRTDGRTGMTKLILAFRNFSNVPETQFTPNKKYQYKIFPLKLPTVNNGRLFEKCGIQNIKAGRIYVQLPVYFKEQPHSKKMFTDQSNGPTYVNLLKKYALYKESGRTAP